MDDSLIQALQNAAHYEHETSGFELIETHISWILLTGPYAYKIKKPLNLGFLDFTSLESRRHYCHEELRLNKRLAPELYCEVVAISGTADSPILHGSGSPIEFAVKMVQFEQEARLDHVLERNELKADHIDQLAQTLATFHRQCAVAAVETPFGTAEHLYQPIQECFDQLALLLKPAERHPLEQVQSWYQQEFQRLKPIIEQRKQEGHVRECHGDAHLANMVLRKNQVILFDCIEFSENLRWIDVMSELAFVTMDLIDRQAPGFATRLLNHYLEATGDYRGLVLLRFYQVYRALVRAKIAGIRSQQANLTADSVATARQVCHNYLQLARTLTEHPPPQLWITHGPSGTGKTALSEELVLATGAIRLRSDIERKRLFGMKADAASTAEQKQQLYGDDMTRRVYAELTALSEAVIGSGNTALVDGTFLKRWQRRLFVELAGKLNVPLSILQLEAPAELLRQRIRERQAKQTDASEADLNILQMQLENLEPLDKQEKMSCLSIRTDKDIGVANLVKKLRR